MNDRWPISYSQLAHVSLSALDRASSVVKGVLRWSRKPAHFAVSAAIIGIIGGSAYALAGLIADEGRQAIEAVPLAGAGAEGPEFTFILQAKEQDTLDGYERDLTVSDGQSLWVRLFIEFQRYEDEVATFSIKPEVVEEGYLVMRALGSSGDYFFYSDIRIRPHSGPVLLQPVCDSVAFYRPDEEFPDVIPDWGFSNPLYGDGIEVSSYFRRHVTSRGWIVLRLKATPSERMDYSPTCSV